MSRLYAASNYIFPTVTRQSHRYQDAQGQLHSGQSEEALMRGAGGCRTKNGHNPFPRESNVTQRFTAVSNYGWSPSRKGLCTFESCRGRRGVRSSPEADRAPSKSHHPLTKEHDMFTTDSYLSIAEKPCTRCGVIRTVNPSRSVPPLCGDCKWVLTKIQRKAWKA